MGWDGLYEIHMFQKAPQSDGVVRIPYNLQNLLDQEDPVDDEITLANISTMRTPSPNSASNFCTNTSILELIEGNVEHETPFSDDELDPLIDNFAEDEVLWNNPDWRKRLETKLCKKIEETKVSSHALNRIVLGSYCYFSAKVRFFHFSHFFIISRFSVQ